MPDLTMNDIQYHQMRIKKIKTLQINNLKISQVTKTETKMQQKMWHSTLLNTAFKPTSRPWLPSSLYIIVYFRANNQLAKKELISANTCSIFDYLHLLNNL